MLFASTFYENFMFNLFVFFIFAAVISKKIAASKGPVSSAAKDYAKQKAVSFFTRFMK